MKCENCKTVLSFYRDITTKQSSIRCNKCLLSTHWFETHDLAIEAWELNDTVAVKYPADFNPIRKSKSNYAEKQKQMENEVVIELEDEEEFGTDDLRKK